MKNSLRFSLLLILTVFAASISAQNKEIPNKKTTTRPQTGGPEGGNGASTGSNGSGSGNNNSGGGDRPVYRPRMVNPNPYIYYPPVYYNPDVNNNSDNSGISDAQLQKQIAERKRAQAEVNLKKALFEFKAHPQAFDVKDVSKGFDIIGAKGFKVSFPELAFVDAEGNPVLGEVEIELTEFTENSEFAEAGLTTMTVDGEMLETGGMVNIEAKSGDQKLKLAKGKTIQIGIPDVTNPSGFQTFYGSGTDIVKWSLDPQSGNNDTSSSTPFDGYTFKMVNSTQMVNGKPVVMQIFRNWKNLDEYVNENLKVSDGVRAKIFKDGIPFLYTIELNAMGKVKEVNPKYPEYSNNTLISEIQGKIKAILMDAPALAMTEGNMETGRTYDIMIATAKNYTGPQPKFIVVNAPLDQNKEKKHDTRTVNANPNSENVDGFVLESSGLSKINCDRFTGSNSQDTQNFHFERADAKIYVVFKDQRSFIQPSGANGNYMLTKVPTGSAVRYVAVVYGDDGSIKMGVKDDKTASGNVEFEELVAFSADKLKFALNPLN